MASQIMQSIKSIVGLNEDEERAFASILTIKQFKKKEFLLQEGKICANVSFVNNGCMRLFYNVDGVQNTIQFFFGDSWYTDYASFLTGKPTIENMQALEPCEVVQFKKDDLYKLYNRFPVFEKVGRVMAENAYLSLSRLNQMLTNEEPQQRYLMSISESNQVPLPPIYLPTASLCYKMNTVRTRQSINC